MSEKKLLPDKCAVARDLMPLCVDGTASDASQRKVKKHVNDCPPCSKVYQEMQTQIELTAPDQQETAQFETAVKKVKHKHAWRKLRNVLLGIVMALVVCAGLAYGYYWYFVEEVPLPLDLYELEIYLSAPKRETTPAIIRTKNMPRPAKVHIEVRFDGTVLNADNVLEPSWVMHIWASTTRSVDLDTCGYTNYNYYAFDQAEAEDTFVFGNELFKVNSIYRGAPEEAQDLLFKLGMKDLRWTTIGNLVLRNVATLTVKDGGNAGVHFTTLAPVATLIPQPEVTMVPQSTITPLPTSTPRHTTRP